MAVHDFTNDVQTNALVDFIGSPSECFLCAKPLDGRIVYWRGTHTLFLHLDCARELGCHLIGDAIRGTKPHTVGQIVTWPEVTERLSYEFKILRTNGNHRRMT